MATATNTNEEIVCEKNEKTDVLVTVDVQHTRKVFLYEERKWNECGDVPEMYPQDGVCICYIPNGFVLIGGLTKACALAHRTATVSSHHFSALTKQWRKMEDMKTPRALVSAAEMTSMKLLVVGGMTTGSFTDKSTVCEVLDVALGTWSSAACLPRPMAEPLVAAAAKRVFVLERASLMVSVY
jgi:N-acetylneuraminic acid mutarotase